MPRYDHPGIGHLVQALSLKLTDTQREIAALRQEIRTLTYLVRELQAQDNKPSAPESETDVQTR